MVSAIGRRITSLGWGGNSLAKITIWAGAFSIPATFSRAIVVVTSWLVSGAEHPHFIPSMLAT